MGLSAIIFAGALLRLGTIASTSLGDQEPTSSASSCLLQSQRQLTRELASREVREAESPRRSLTHTNSIDATSEAVVERDPSKLRNCPWLDTSAALHNLSFIGYEDHGHGYQGLFVYPPKKLAFCLIEKNACSTWIRHIFQPLFFDSSPNCTQLKEGCPDGRVYSLSERSQKEFGTSGIESVFQDPKATRAVFVRDPLERFASAFINKCIDGDNTICPMQSRVFKDAVEWVLHNDMTNIDGHWLPQAFHCELNKRIQGYNVVFAMNQDTFTRDMNCFLERAGLNNFINDTQPNASPSNRSANLTTVLQKLYTPEAARSFIEKVPFDYDVFGFSKEPEWIAGATGEWYDKEPSQEQSSIQRRASLGRAAESFLSDDTDDLVELAFQAGYGV